MIGKYTVRVENSFLRYDFEIKRNITVIRGDSATGKTTLIEMIDSYNKFGNDSGIKVNCSKKCVVLSGQNWKRDLELIGDSIVFIDEFNRFTSTTDFANAIKGTDNYYVIVSRQKLSNLPYSVHEIYGIRNSGKYNHLEKMFTENEFYQIYEDGFLKEIVPDLVVVEDSNSGFEFYKTVCDKYGIKCCSSYGKSNIIKKIKDFQSINILIVVDGAAFGSEILEVMHYIKTINSQAYLFCPESFEYLILSSKLFNNNRSIANKLNKTFMYADSCIYFSWEQFYTHLLVDVTDNTVAKYRKTKLNLFYLSNRNIQIILDAIPYNLKFVKRNKNISKMSLF